MTHRLSWTTDQIAAAADGTPVGSPMRVTGISIDSRTVAPGDLFIALKGPSFDGHAFVDKALAAGAVAALVHDAGALPDGKNGILVDNTLKGMEGLGRAGRARSKARIAAVTGSVGKTGVKEAVAFLLGKQGICHHSPGSFNNHWGVPLSLSRLPESTDYAVFEIGMNHPGEITPLVDMVKPEVVVITTVVGAHMEFFDSEEQIAAAKAEILSGLTPDGTAVLNRDNRHYEFLRAEADRLKIANIVAFGAHRDADVRVLDAELLEDRSRITAEFCGKRLTYTIGIPGAHWVGNSLAVLATVGLLDADLDQAAADLAEVRPPRRRGERHQLTLPDGGTAVLIDDSYNASPAAVEAALAQLGALSPDGRRIAVLGDMRELGAQADVKHAALADPIRAAGVQQLFCHGPHMRALAAEIPAIHHDTPETLAEAVVERVSAGDVVLVKGSLGSRTKLIADALLDAYGPARNGED